MDKKIAGLLGAVAGVATLGGAAQAAPATPANTTEPMAAHSYAALLAQVPNALEALKADDAARADQPRVQLADSVVITSAHHHHHHHRKVIVIKRHRHHHYHHHHHAHAFIGVPGVGGVVVHER